MKVTFASFQLKVIIVLKSKNINLKSVAYYLPMAIKQKTADLFKLGTAFKFLSTAAFDLVHLFYI